MTISTPSFRTVLVLSAALRVALILYSEWHDRRSIVKYTDVDYRVFTDAAHFLLHPSASTRAQGPIIPFLRDKYGVTLTVGDPYNRETYRYTPLLALLLTPNVWLHPSFGKYLFALCDILNGIFIYRLLLSEVLRTTKSSEKPSAVPAETGMQLQDKATLYTSLHLFNPLVFSISTRGSSESLLCLFVLLTLYAALKRRWSAAAVLLGLSTHWKIYPVIYGAACLGVIAEKKGNRGGWRRYVNCDTVKFGLTSAGTFLALGAGCYVTWGYPFLYESYLYHLHRLDHRHNFSPYFYLTYLTYPPLGLSASAYTQPLSLWTRIARLPFVSFVPQMSLALGTGFAFGKIKHDLVFAWFVQTVVFVLFNKVCTSQYFLWYLLFLPLLVPRLSTSGRKALVYIAMWFGTQALWLAEAYKLEFLGQNVFLGLWMRSLVYVIGNVWVIQQSKAGEWYISCAD